MSETRLQIAMVDYLRAVLTPPTMFAHVPNGGMRSKREAALLKAMGVLPGMPDLIVMAPGPRTLFLEVKLPKKGVASEAQDAFKEAAERMGFAHAYVRSIDDVRAALKASGIVTRESVAA